MNPDAPVENNDAPVEGDQGNEPVVNDAPVDNGSHLQPGQSPSDLDFDAILDEAEAEEQAAKDAEEQRLADEQAEKDKTEADEARSEQDRKDQEAADQKAKDDAAAAAARGEVPNPVDPSQLTDIKTIDNYFDTQADERFGIAPMPEIRNPEPDETAADYFKNVTAPAILQLQTNMAGFSARNVALREAENSQVDEQRTNALLSDIDGLVKNNAIPAYKLDASGQMDPNSEGGKVVSELFTMVNEYNSKPENANSKITSLKLAYHELYKPAQEAAAKKAAAESADAKRRGAAGILNGTGRGGAAGNSAKPRAARPRGGSVVDLDFDNLLA